VSRTRITISLSAKNSDSAIVLRALEKAPHWKRSAELVRWAAAYLNGESLARAAETVPGLDMTEDEFDALFDAF
jgi:hypothetical protein